MTTRASNRMRPAACALAILSLAGCGGAPAAPAGPIAAGPTRADEPPPVTAGRAPVAGEYAGGVDVLHYDLELSLPTSGSHIEGLARLVLTAPPEALDPLVVDLTGLGVEEVRVDGAVVPIRLGNGKLSISVDGPIAGADTLTVDIRYGGTPDDGLILRDNVHGQPAAFADNWPNRARFWFPAVDRPGDKATVSFTVHAPAAWHVVANGALVGTPAPTTPGSLGGAEGRRTWRWATSVPIPTYTMVVGAADLVVREVGLAACGEAPASPRDDGCVVVDYRVFPPDTANGARIFARAADMMDFFTELIGPFPYEKMANVQSATRFGGMENASAIFYSEQGIAAGRDMEGTVSHEIAHQWFGDSVTEADWHHLWLSEGFATYFGALFFEEADGEDRFRQMIDGNRRRVLGSADVARPVVDPAEHDLFRLLNDNNYPKGGLVLHMLRGLVGDDAFFAGIRAYYARYRDATALTADFQAVMEEASGAQLDWFFDQWLFQPGYPVVSVSTEWDEGSGEAVVTVRQEQRSEWPVFRLPVDLELEVAGLSHRRRVDVTRRVESFRLELDGPPTRVSVDPDGFLLMETRGARGPARRR